MRDVATRELKNVVADSIERIYEEFGIEIDRLNAVNISLQLVGALKYGIGGYSAVKIREQEFEVPLCRRHR